MNTKDFAHRFYAMNEMEAKNFLLFLIGRLTIEDTEYNARGLPYSFESSFNYFYDEFLKSEKE